MSPALQSSPQAPLLRSLFIALPFIVLTVARIDYALALILLFCSVALALLPFIRTTPTIKAIIVLGIVLFTGSALYRFVSPCLFTICVAVPWQEQRDTAQHAIADYGTDFAPYAVSAFPTTLTSYRADTDPNLRISFQFIRSMPAGSEVTAPYQLHSIDLNDRDPFRSHEFTPGSAWLSPVQLAERASAFATVQISPRQAIHQAQTEMKSRLGRTINLCNASAELLLADAVPHELRAPAVWEVTATTPGNTRKQIIWIDAHTGMIVKQMERLN
jgi:hypothetical protein